MDFYVQYCPPWPHKFSIFKRPPFSQAGRRRFESLLPLHVFNRVDAIGYSTTPNENKSVRPSNGSARICSGDICDTVPITLPVSVSSACMVRVVPLTALGNVVHNGIDFRSSKIHLCYSAGPHPGSASRRNGQQRLTPARGPVPFRPCRRDPWFRLKVAFSESELSANDDLDRIEQNS